MVTQSLGGSTSWHPAAGLLALLGEDLAHDGWHRRVYEFLGVDPHHLRQPLRFLPNAAIVGFDRLVLSRVFAGAAPALRPGPGGALRARYAPDLELLEGLIGRDLASWRQSAQPEDVHLERTVDTPLIDQLGSAGILADQRGAELRAVGDGE